MLIKYLEHLRKSNNLKLPHKGIVFDNSDPKKLGRIKATVQGIFEDTTRLPWILPRVGFGLGGKNNSSSFSVPEIGSELVIEFPFNDVYFPFYVGFWESSTIHKTLFDEDYPNTYGWQDSTGNHIKINKTQEYAEIMHSSGTYVKILQSGAMQLFVNDAQNVTVTNNVIETFNANQVKNITGNRNKTVNGSETNQIDGNSIETVGGTSSENVTGKKTIVAADIDLDGATGGIVKGVVTGECICAFTGNPHPQVSSNVKATI